MSIVSEKTEEIQNDDDQKTNLDESYNDEDNEIEVAEESPKGRFHRYYEELGSGAYKKVFKGYDNETGSEIAWNIIDIS